MPNPISCVQDKSQAVPTFDCQPVEISGTTTPQTNERTAPEVAPPDPAVQSLVKRATSAGTTLPPRSPFPVSVLPADVPTAEKVKAALNCPSPLADLALTALAAKAGGVIAGFIGGFKIGTDLANCVKPQLEPLQDKLTKQAAEEVCRADGGEPRAWQGKRLICAVPPTETP